MEGDADRRQTVVRLSDQGAEIGAGRRGEREKQWQHWLSHLDDEELRGLAHGLSALLDVVDADAQSALDDVSVMEKT